MTRTLRGAVVLSLLGSAFALSLAATAQESRPKGDGDPATAPQPQRALRPFVAPANTCRACHSHEADVPYTEEQRAGMICRMTEWQFYDQHDKHQMAYDVLRGARGQEMSKRLAQDVLQTQACLNCHTAQRPGMPPLAQPLLAEGVTCVACHGTHREWVLEHQLYDVDTWRNLDRAAKERDYGMTDLWDPVRCATLCASCHIGDAGQGKVLTHAMYAAGHPPLPAFELASFSDAQPRHWQYLREKSKGRLDRIAPHESPGFEQTRLALIGGIVALRQTMVLYADLAEQSVKAPPSDHLEWPDFARFDCYACHHELAASGPLAWRRARGFPAAPGRPGAPEWPEALARASANLVPALAGVPELDALLGEFHTAIGARPFGDPPCTAAAARRIVVWCDSALETLRSLPFDRAQALAFLKKICHTASATTPDYDSARQLAWAARIVVGDLTRSSPVADALHKALASLDQLLLLDLPPQGKQVPIETTLPLRLATLAAYDPAATQALFSEIEKNLPRE
jgi:hypothetical protein